MAEKAAERQLDLREQLLQELLKDVLFRERVEQAKNDCPIKSGGCDPRVYIGLFVGHYKAAELLAKILGLDGPNVPDPNQLVTISNAGLLPQGQPGGVQEADSGAS